MQPDLLHAPLVVLVACTVGRLAYVIHLPATLRRCGNFVVLHTILVLRFFSPLTFYARWQKRHSRNVVPVASLWIFLSRCILYAHISLLFRTRKDGEAWSSFPYILRRLAYFYFFSSIKHRALLLHRLSSFVIIFLLHATHVARAPRS